MKVLIVTDKVSDLSDILTKRFNADMISVDKLKCYDILQYECICLLGGFDKKPLILPIDARLKIEEANESGIRMFIEYTGSFGDVYSAEPLCTVSQRLVYIGAENSTLKRGDLLDDHCNDFSYPYYTPKSSYPIMYYGGNVMKHSHTNDYDEKTVCSQWGLWMYDSNVMMSSFRVQNFIKARFAPFERWKSIVEQIISFIVGEGISLDIKPVYSFRKIEEDVSDSEFDNIMKETVGGGMKWFERNGLYIDNGAGGVLEGMSHNIEADGFQRTADAVRNDCSGEVGGACFFDYLINKSTDSLEKYKNTAAFNFDKMQVKKGLHKGMMRWTTTAWGVCYQDDVARTILGTLLEMKLTGDRSRMEDVCDALDFMVKTTGTDGLRPFRTDNYVLDQALIENLSSQPAGFPSGHYNGYYHAVLLIAYSICGNAVYLDTALKGLTSIMNVFPDTVREHSETEELCRLVLPLACLYNTTHDQAHLAWLKMVTSKLDGYRHKCGGFCEVDPGYKAQRSRSANGESSLLCDNGDSVADLLYASNWLPLGFAYAYYATKDKYFYDEWRSIALFMARAQIVSENVKINGAWARGIDMDMWDLYGAPHDIGWGPCCIESGWTVAEILMGIMFGMYVKSTESSESQN